jgi:hypothetical protein
LVCLQHRAGLRVVDDRGPEVLGRNWSRQVQPVGLAAVERIVVGVFGRPGIGRATLAQHKISLPRARAHGSCA